MGNVGGGIEKQSTGRAFPSYNTVGLITDSLKTNYDIFFPSHSSSFSKSAAYITHNAT